MAQTPPFWYLAFWSFWGLAYFFFWIAKGKGWF